MVGEVSTRTQDSWFPSPALGREWEVVGGRTKPGHLGSFPWALCDPCPSVPLPELGPCSSPGHGHSLTPAQPLAAGYGH